MQNWGGGGVGGKQGVFWEMCKWGIGEKLTRLRG